MLLKDKLSFITGSARGIGKTIALKFAEEGSDIIVCDVNEAGIAETVAEIEKAGRKALGVKMDVTNLASVESAVNGAMEKFGKIDILVNNAGITKDNLLLRMKEEDWDAVLTVNLKGVFVCTKLISRIMLRQKSGKIVNVASVIGLMGNAGQSNYSASKAGIIGFTKSCAKEFASRSINVNAVAPGYIQTEMTKGLPDDIKEKMLKYIPMEKFGTTEDVANVILFLASPLSDYVTGEVVRIDGGMAM